MQSEDGQSAEYRLKAIQSHTLQLNSGHYWTLVVKNQQIIECNDVTINVEPMNSVDHQKIIESAYVVFYKKTDRTEYQLASPSKLEKDKVKLTSSTDTAEDTESEKDADEQPEKVTTATETTDDTELEKDEVKLSSSTDTAEDTESEKDADEQPEKVTTATETTDDGELEKDEVKLQ